MTATDVLHEPAAPRWASLEPQALARTWHAVARAADVGDAPVRVELLDTQLVLARLDGTVAAFDDVCAHRGAALSLGRVEGSCLACPYHGWEYAASGECTRIPSLTEGRHVPAAARLTARHCAERGGLVWVCLGEPLAGVPAFPEPAAGWRVIVGEPYEWACDPTRRLENFLDFAHFAFVHDGVLGRRDDPYVPRHTVVVDDLQMYVHQERHEPTSAVKPAGGEPATFSTVVDYVVHLPLAAVLDQRMPGGQRFVLGIASTPVGDGASRTFWVLARDYDLDGDDATYIAFQKNVNEQDRPVIESLRPEFVPLDVTAELHVRDVDQVAIAYRRALLDLNTRTRGDELCS